MKNQYRQGDVFLVQVECLPRGSMPAQCGGRVILAHGEATGHTHSVSTEFAQLYYFHNQRLLKVRRATQLIHQEHSAITVEPGVYQVVQQREYTPQAVQRVMD